VFAPARTTFYDGVVARRDLRYYTTILTERAMGFFLDRYSSRWLFSLNVTTPYWPSARIRAGENLVLVRLHSDRGSHEVFKAMVGDLDRSVGEVMSAQRCSGQAALIWTR
jgi:hypothetical protein